MYAKAYEQVFGKVNTGATSRTAEHGEHRVMRVGKTAKDKASGHVPYKKNRRVFEGGSKGSEGKWTKV